MILVDTSVWVEVFRASRPLDLEAVVDFDDVATCLPVIHEVLQGFRDEAAFRRAREAMLSLPVVESPLAEDVFSLAVDLYRSERSGSPGGPGGGLRSSRRRFATDAS